MLSLTERDGPAAAGAERRDAAQPLPQRNRLFNLDRPLREARDAFEKHYLEYHLALQGGNVARVAKAVGLERTNLYRKFQNLGITLDPAAPAHDPFSASSSACGSS